MKDNYDEELEKIRKYIEQRRANNYGMGSDSNKSNGNNPLYNKETTEVLSRISRRNRSSNEDNINNLDILVSTAKALQDLYNAKNASARYNMQQVQPK